MRTLLIDPFSGAAGDMIIGALLDCGADRTAVTQAMASVVGEPTIISVSRCGIKAVHIKTHAGQQHRTIGEVISVIKKAKAPEPVKKMAERVFLRIHRAEESIHGTHAHFHEVGADDAVADVIGACTALSSLNPDHVAVLPVSLGRASIESAHGTYPVPCPATLAILKESDLRVRHTDEIRELCTPTGAALLAEFADRNRTEDLSGTIVSIGYGAGSRDPKHTPNVLRASILETPGQDNRIDILETNVDDVTGEVIAYTLKKLVDKGARDASATPMIMKKGRSGHLIRVICKPENTSRLAGIMADELGTLGIRCLPAVHRLVADRNIEAITLKLAGKDYSIGVKIGRWEGKTTSLKAEFEDVRICAEETGLPLKKVARMAEEAGWHQIGEKKEEQ